MSLIVRHQLNDVRKGPEGLSVPTACLSQARTSQKLVVDNKSKTPIKNVALAYLAHGEDFWAVPIEIKEVKPGKQTIIDLSKKKMRIFQYKLKFFVGGQVHLIEEIPVPGGTSFYQCIGIDYMDDGFASWNSTSPINQ